MIKQEVEQLKVDKLCLRRTRTNAQELSNSFHTNGTVGSFFQKTTCKCVKKWVNLLICQFIHKKNEINTKQSGFGWLTACVVLLMQKCFAFVFTSKTSLVQNNKIILTSEDRCTENCINCSLPECFPAPSAAPTTCANRLHVIYNPHHHFSGFNITFGPLKSVFAFSQHKHKQM